MSYLEDYSNSLALCHNLVHGDLDLLLLQQDITLTHYIDDILLIGHSYKELASTIELMVRHLLVRGWEINVTRFQSFYLSKYLWRWSMGHVEIFFLR